MSYKTLSVITKHYREKLNRCRGTICNLTSEENSLRENLEQERNNQNMYVNIIVTNCVAGCSNI